MSPEFSRPLSPARVSAAGLGMKITADAAECAALAKRFGLPAIAALACRFTLRPARVGGAYEAVGELEAVVTQICVISLDPFEAIVTEKFSLLFVPEETEEENPDPDAVDEVPFVDGMLELGEAAAEQLALALDPYPRKPGATLDDAGGDDGANPFAALARLKRLQ